MASLTAAASRSSSVASNAISRSSSVASTALQERRVRDIQVPHHLLDTKLFSQNIPVHQGSVKADPQQVHFVGYEPGKAYSQFLRVINSSSVVQRVHVIPPSSPNFTIYYVKQNALVPGMSYKIRIQFTAEEWQPHFYDTIRLHCKDDQNVQIPLHAYPALSKLEFPKRIDFPTTAIMQRRDHTITLHNEIPVDFSFRVQLKQGGSDLSVDPVEGEVPGLGSVDITVTYIPKQFTTSRAEMTLQTSEFGNCLQRCKITATCTPGQTSFRQRQKQAEKSFEQGGEDVSPGTAQLLDPRTIIPVERARARKAQSVLPRTLSSKEVVKDGLRFPKNLNTPAAVSYVITQKARQLKAKDITEGKSDVASAYSRKEAVFIRLHSECAAEERANELRWVTRVGESPVTEAQLENVQRLRLTEQETYRKHRHIIKSADEMASVSTYERTGVWRSPAEIQVDTEVSFDDLENNPWQRRFASLRRFTQAVNKVVIQQRMQRVLDCLRQLVHTLKAGRVPNAPSVTDKSSAPLSAFDLDVFSFRPGCVDSISILTEPQYSKDTDVFMGLKTFPQLTSNLREVIWPESFLPMQATSEADKQLYVSYSAHQLSTYIPVEEYTPVGGASDELLEVDISERTATDHQTQDSKAHQDMHMLRQEPATKAHEQALETDEANERTSHDDVIVMPKALRQPTDHPSLHIFNPAPGVFTFHRPLVAYNDVDDGCHLLPLPLHALAGDKMLDHKDVISEVMQWPHQSVSALDLPSATPSAASLPRWRQTFSNDLLTNDIPSCQTSLADDDNLDELETNPTQLPFPEMIPVAYYLPEHQSSQDKSIAQKVATRSGYPSGKKPSSETSEDHHHSQKKKSNRLGAAIERRWQSMLALVKNDELREQLRTHTQKHI